MTQPAGWYADPSGLPARRWWDGGQWTDHIQPGGAPIPPPNGFFPAVPPTGPAAPGDHTTTPSLYAAQPAGLQHGGQPVAPAAPAPHPEVPTAPYTMQPVDAVSPQLGFVTPDPAPAPVLEQASPQAWRRIAGPVALALIAVLVLVLTGFILLG